MHGGAGTLDFTSTLAQIRSSLNGEKPIEDQSYTTEATLAVPIAEPKPNGKKKKNRGVSPISIASSNGSTEKLSETLSPNPVERNQTRSEDGEKAMMLDRGVEGGLDGVIGLGPSRAYLSIEIDKADDLGLVGFDGLVVEEDTDSGGMTSLLIFRHDP